LQKAKGTDEADGTTIMYIDNCRENLQKSAVYSGGVAVMAASNRRRLDLSSHRPSAMAGEQNKGTSRR
jgi:hypothetical protein